MMSPHLFSSGKRPMCKHGTQCYRQNPDHLRQFSHPEGSIHSRELFMTPRKQVRRSELESSVLDTPPRRNPVPEFNTLFTLVGCLDDDYNTHAMTLRELLSSGTIVSSAQFNFMVDLDWLLLQYPKSARNKPLTIVTGDNLTGSSAAYAHITKAKARLHLPYGVHHTKMMLLELDVGLQVVIHTANLVPQDWDLKTQAMWVSPVFPKQEVPDSKIGDSGTHFKRDLLEYMDMYALKELDPWIHLIRSSNMQKANVILIGSTPGRHQGKRLNSFGHMKLRSVLAKEGPAASLPPWNIVAQCSSIGSLGAKSESWLFSEFMTSMSTTSSSSPIPLMQPEFSLVYPTVHNVRDSLEGYAGGCSLPYTSSTHGKQTWLRKYFHRWSAAHFGRTFCLPHIKCYSRMSPDSEQVSWFILSSANLSKAAWGALEKERTQLMIRSYELGVLFLPRHLNAGLSFKTSDTPIPYDSPLMAYGKDDAPWLLDMAYTSLDTHNCSWQPKI